MKEYVSNNQFDMLLETKCTVVVIRYLSSKIKFPDYFFFQKLRDWLNPKFERVAC